MTQWSRCLEVTALKSAAAAAAAAAVPMSAITKTTAIYLLSQSALPEYLLEIKYKRFRQNYVDISSFVGSGFGAKQVMEV